MTALAVHAFERRSKTILLEMLNNASQWMDTSSYRSCFCIGFGVLPTNWSIEGQLPDGQVVVLGSYPGKDINEDGVAETSEIFNSPKYITVNAMCGLPIRFVSSNPQPSNARFFAVLKS